MGRNTISFVALSLIASLPFCMQSTIDNYLTETPTVKCGPDSIEVSGTTKNDFEGIVFVKNWRHSPGCFQSYERPSPAHHNVTKRPSFSLHLRDISKCGLQLRRNTNSKDLEVFAVVVFSFHPSFQTASDRVFAVHCLFEQHQLTVASKYNVATDLTTKYNLGATAIPPIPELKIVAGRVPDETLAAARSVSVGDFLMFIFHLPAPSEIYGFRVRDCMAETLQGRRTKIIAEGCTTDDTIVSNIQYSENNDKAFSDAMAFKFPDVEELWVFCSVQLCLQRREHLRLLSADLSQDLCPRQHNCTKRQKRNAEGESPFSPLIYNLDTLIVANKLNVHNTIINETDSLSPKENIIADRTEEHREPIPSSAWCMLRSVFSAGLALLFTIHVSTIFAAIVLLYSIKRTPKAPSL